MFPQISAGIIFQNGTAAGKLHALIIPQTPSGLRYVNNSLSGNSEFTVCPYSLRPSDWKKRQVSIASWTLPAASLRVLPISRVSNATIASLCSINNRPILPMICPLVGAGVAAQSVNAERAAAIASCTSSLVDSGKSPNTSTSIAGFLLVNLDPSDEDFSCPLMILYPLTLGRLPGLLLSKNSRPVSKTCVMPLRLACRT